MAQVNKLYRNFIILQEDERGYSNCNDKALSGYSKIEAKGEKCKVSFYAQNLKNDSDDYCIMLICNKKDSKKLIDLGKIKVSEGGKAEVTKEYFVDNIAGVGIPYDKISGAAIVKMKDGIPIFIMCGFMNGEQPSENWKNYKVIKAEEGIIKIKPKVEVPKKEKDKDKNKEKKKEKEKKYDKDKNKKDECKREEVEVNMEDITSEREESDSVEEITKVQEIEEVEEVKEEVEVSEEVKEKIREELREELKEEVRKEINEEINTSKNEERTKFDDYEELIQKKSDNVEIRGSVGEYFEGIANGFEHYRGYKEIKNCKWYKVQVNDLYEMCNMSNYNKYTVAYYPMLNYYPYIKKYGYFMLGYKCDKEGNLKYIVYGVPGKKDKNEQPYEGKTGFVTWISDEDKDSLGCWLMFYDFRNSTVVVPMQ